MFNVVLGNVGKQQILVTGKDDTAIVLKMLVSIRVFWRRKMKNRPYWIKEERRNIFGGKCLSA